MEDAGADTIICGPIDRPRAIRQEFIAPVSHLSGISVVFGTYCIAFQHNLELSVELLEASPDTFATDEEKWVEICRTTIRAAGITNNGDFYFYFPTVVDSKARRFVLTIGSPDAQVDESVTAYLSRSNTRIPGHVEFRGRDPHGEEFGLVGRLITSNP